MSGESRELDESLINSGNDHIATSAYYNSINKSNTEDAQQLQWIRRVVLMALAVIVLTVLTLSVLWATVATVFAVKNAQQRPSTDDFSNPSLFHIVSINDCYELSPVSVFINGKTQLRGGASRVSQYVKQLRNTVGSQNVLLLGGGDFVSPSLASSFFYGKQMIEALNAMEMNYTCIGNHELDFGTDVFAERIKESKFPWMISNVYDSVTDVFTMYPSMIDSAIIPTSMPNLKIGLFGVIYPFLQTSIKVNQTRYSVVDFVEVAKLQVEHLKSKGATFIIALTHVAGEEDCLLARNVPQIDLIISGHDHNVKMSQDCRGAPYFTATQDFQNLWHLTINTTSATAPPKINFKNVIMSPELPVDPAIETIIAKYDSDLKERFAEEIGDLTESMDARTSTVRSSECSFANFLTDLLRTTVKADVALINGGTIRSNRIIPAGKITKGTVYEALPFGNTVGGVIVTIEDIRTAMEKALSGFQDGSGAFPQVSGLKYTFSPARPAGARLVSLQFANGTNIAPGTSLRLASTEYILDGGDGYTALKDKPVFYNPKESPFFSAVVVDYIKQIKVLKPVLDNRVTQVAAVEQAETGYVDNTFVSLDHVAQVRKLKKTQ